MKRSDLLSLLERVKAMVDKIHPSHSPDDDINTVGGMCPRCIGTGRYYYMDGSFKPCALCNGTGKIPPNEQWLVSKYT